MKPNTNSTITPDMTSTPKAKTGMKDDTDNNDSTSDNTDDPMGDVVQLLKKLQFSLALFGMFHYTNACIGSKNEELRRRVIPSKAAVYNLTVLLGMFGYFVKGIVAYFVVDVDPDYSALYHVPIGWGLQVTLNVFLLLKLSHPRFGNTIEAHDTWITKVVPLITELKLTERQRNVKRHMLIILIMGSSWVATNMSLMAFFLLYPNTKMSNLLTSVVISPLPINIYTRITMLIAMVYISVATIMSLVYVIIVCILTKLCFKICAQAVQEANESVTEPGVYPGCLRRQRLLHLYTCEAVEYFDKDVKYLFANVFFTTVPIACLTLYQMFKADMDLLSMAVHAIWLAFFMMSMTAICAYAASMHNAAHAPLRYLYRTGMQGITLDQLGEMNLFMSQLTANPIGFTILDFFVITREFVLTVGGLFLTYSFVLLQF